MATILVVDDNASNRSFLTTLLGYDGHRLFEAGDGAEGIDAVRRERPDLVIADIVMPTMDGFEFVRRVRSEAPIAGTNVIFYSAAYYEHEARKLAEGCGVRHILTKPSEPELILRTVHEALGLAAPVVSAPQPDFDREHLRLMTDKLSQKVGELEAVSLRLERLLEMSGELAREHDPERLVTAVATAAREVIGASYSAAGMIDEDDTVRYSSFRGLPEELNAEMSSAPIPRPAREAMATRRPVRLRNPGGDPVGLGLPRSHPPVHSYLTVPIVAVSRLRGWLGLRNKIGADEFTAQDEEIATLLAAQAAVAYENALLYAKVRRHASELEERVKERTAELSRSNAELEQFAYAASHDLQEPLRKITGFTTLVVERWGAGLDPTAREFLTYAADGAVRMRQLINDLLAYSRAGRATSEPSEVPLARPLAIALDNVRAAVEETGAVVRAGALPSVLGDERQLAQLFQNLLENAIKFRGERTPEIDVTAEREGDRVRVSVKDNGIGIEPQYAGRIFGVFQRLHTREEYPGTGIGLAICKRVVERQGGEIHVEQGPGGGATFVFTLPGSGRTNV
jgi:signal transduction histidine kinase/CheY-like chemotaxis protein